MAMSTSLSGREVPFARLPNSHTSRMLLVRAAHCRINSTLSAGRSIVPPIFLLLAFDGWRCRVLTLDGDFFQTIPELVFKADAGHVVCNLNRALRRALRNRKVQPAPQTY